MFVKWIALFFLFLPCYTSCLVEMDAGVETRFARYSYKCPCKIPQFGLSKLRWDNIRVVELFTETRWHWKKRGYIRCLFDLGSIIHAKHADIDYFFKIPYEKTLVSLSHISGGDGEYIVLDSGIGRRYSPFSSCFSFIPMLGFSYRQICLMGAGGRQKFHIAGEKGVEYYNLHFKGHCGSLRVCWYSPWIGFDYAWSPMEKIVFRGKWEGHVFLQRSFGFWDVRDWHWKEQYPGIAIVTELSGFYQFDPCHYIGIKMGYELWDSVTASTTFSYDYPEGSTEYEVGEKLEITSPKMHCVFENFTIAFVLHRRF